VPNFALYFVETLDKPFGLSAVFALSNAKIRLLKIVSTQKSVFLGDFCGAWAQAYWTYGKTAPCEKRQKDAFCASLNYIELAKDENP